MAKLTNEFLRKAHALRADFVEKLPERFRKIAADWQQWKSDIKKSEVLSELHRNLHSLAGAGATFGFAEVSNKARQFDNFVKDFLERDRQYRVEDDLLFDGFLELLVEASYEDSSSSENWLRTQQDLQATMQLRSVAPSVNMRLVYVVEANSTSREIVHQLSHFGFEIQAFKSFTEFEKAVTKRLPLCVVIDTNFPDDSIVGELVRIRDANKAMSNVPVIFLAVKDGVTERLSAIRVNAVAYLVKPFEATELVDKIDAILSNSNEDRYRVLVIDTAKTFAEQAASSLAVARIDVVIETHVNSVLEKIRNFNPDLILMDLNLVECSSLELTRVIRQHDSWVTIPIIYIATETDIQRQFEFVVENGDNYLVRPLNPTHLRAIVDGRVKRARQLRSFMVRDSLTGLFNHTTIKEKLTSEVARASRLNTPIVFGMIDIDLFKRVNDSYGHPAGDRVIKSLAQLLQQRLRRTDIVGRYGGEEFALLLLDTRLDDARVLVDEIRDTFASMTFTAGDQHFNVTFSAGLADFPTISTPSTLCDSADYALYRAKQMGRNRVVCFDSDALESN